MPDCIQCGRAYPGGQRGGHCTTCHQSFKSDGAFEKHRTGPHHPSGLRRCRSPDEMLAIGLVQKSDTGYWALPGTWTGPDS